MHSFCNIDSIIRYETLLETCHESSSSWLEDILRDQDIYDGLGKSSRIFWIQGKRKLQLVRLLLAQMIDKTRQLGLANLHKREHKDWT